MVAALFQKSKGSIMVSENDALQIFNLIELTEEKAHTGLLEVWVVLTRPYTNE